MDFHDILMKGPLNTDNIRALDGTLAATIANSTGDVNFQRDIEARDIDARRNLTVFNNLEVQGPLSTFIQDISIGQDADITRDLSVGQDADITRDLDVGRNADIVSNLTVGNKIQTANLRMTGSGPTAGKLLTAVDALGNVTWGSGGTAGVASVPTGEKILFFKNTAVLGYTIITTVDDDAVYITKGTAAGGEAGGVAKPGSTWSQPTHVHATRPHTLTLSEIPSHRHPADPYIGNFMGSGGNTHGEGGDSYGTRPYTGYAGGGAAHSHGNTYAGGGGSTWRPKGQNFTLQQRN
jgi:hypothetical protein